MVIYLQDDFSLSLCEVGFRGGKLRGTSLPDRCLSVGANRLELQVCRLLQVFCRSVDDLGPCSAKGQLVSGSCTLKRAVKNARMKLQMIRKSWRPFRQMES